MRKIYKLISILLAVMMLLGSITVLATLNVFAADDTSSGETSGTDNTDGDEVTTEAETEVIGEVDYINDVFANPDEKLRTMRLALTKGDFKLYIDDYSGEVACVNVKTGEKIFTNPYDIGASTGNEDTKYDILSQLIVTFTDTTGQEKIFTSYEEAALREQIVYEPIMNGIRVEYTIGRESSKILVPRLISVERFKKMILQPLEEYCDYNDKGEPLLYKARFNDEDLIDGQPISELKKAEIFEIQKVLSYYMVYDKNSLFDKNGDGRISKSERAEQKKYENVFGGVYVNLVNSDAQYARALKNFPIIETMPVIVFDPDASESELTKAEDIIGKYCPEYTYEELEYDHLLTEYKSDDQNPPVFRMALEYTIDEENGALSVRLPANGIRFNESLYTLSNIEILPYMGAGNSAYSGYNFFPDGSGTLFDFEELNVNQTRSVNGKVYGTDFAYHEITGTYQKVIRYPVFGIVEDTTYYTYTEYDNNDEVSKVTTIAGAIVDAIKATSSGDPLKACEGQVAKLETAYRDTIMGITTIEKLVSDKRGFVAIIEEGDALTSISTYHAGALSDYNTIKMQVTPRPKDSYNLSDSISVGADTEWTVVSDRKYVGNYKIKYIMLSDLEKTTEEYKTYDASWFGMAVAYRDYLTRNKVISKNEYKTDANGKVINTAEQGGNLTQDIPLYIETFGTIETTEKILSIPVTVMAPLTTFENIEQMYNDLSAPEQGMNNINFKLTGYANGGMYYSVPGRLKFERSVGGNKGFQALLDAANKVNESDPNKNFGIFPDFDFVYKIEDDILSGYNAFFHGGQTIDGRYSSKKAYSATQQKYVNYYEMVISPAYFSEFYEKLDGNYYGKYNNVIGISLSTLGTDINSDFDEDEPYNREDAKEFSIKAFEYFKENHKDTQIMTDGGNAYVWKYVDHILDVSLDSSRYNFSSSAVPFIGVVLHGSISFTGEPLNMEGDLQYAILKAIENGASPYFILSYQNTNVLKEDEQLSKYYSIRYDIWKEDIKETYDILNETLGDVQDKYITNHEFLSGVRVPDADELTADILADYEASLEAERNAAELLQKEIALAASIARENGRVAEAYAAEAVVEALELYTSQMEAVNKAVVFDSNFYKNVKSAYAEYIKVLDYAQYKNSDKPEEQKLYEQYVKIDLIYNAVTSYNQDYKKYETIYDEIIEKRDALAEGGEYKSYKTAIFDIYEMYADGEILREQIETTIYTTAASEALANALADYKAGTIDKAALDAYIANFAVSKVDMSSFNEALNAYLEGTLADDALEDARGEFNAKIKELKSQYKGDDAGYNAAIVEPQNAFKAVVAQYQDGTLNRIALNNIIDEWLGAETTSKEDLDAAIEQYKKGEIDDKKIDPIIASYALSSMDKAKLLAAIDNYDTQKATYDAAYNSFTLEKLEDAEYDAAVAAYETAKETFDKAVDDFVNGGTAAKYKNALGKFETALNEYRDAVARHNVTDIDEAGYNAALEAFKTAEGEFNGVIATYVTDEMNEAELKKVSDAYIAKSEAYIKYVAADSAFNAVIDSGFVLDYDECYEVYFNHENLDRYSAWGKLATSEGATQEIYDIYISYLNAYKASAKLKDSIKSNQIKYGTFDNYTVARAQLDVLIDLGYDKSEDEAEYTQYTKALALAQQSRRNAITNVATTDGTLLRDLRLIMKEADGHLKLAVEAIETLAISENVTVEYEEGKYVEGAYENVLYITNYDEIAEQSFIVAQAIDRAINTYYYIMADKFTAISDGRDSGYDLNGHDLLTTRDSTGKTIYFYGTLEGGYSYFTRNDADGTFEIHHMGQRTGVKTAQGLEIFEYKDDSGRRYYTATLEQGYTYYSKDSNGAYTVADPTEYNGVEVGALEDGTKVYRDGDIYYSVNEDGSYTRYTYQKSIKSGLDEAEAAMATGKATVTQMSADSYDKTIVDDLNAKIDRNYQMNNKGDDDEAEEETEDFRYVAGNIVAVTYGDDYKTLILNYNNYTVRVVYNGTEYTIPAYDFVKANKEG